MMATVALIVVLSLVFSYFKIMELLNSLKTQLQNKDQQIKQLEGDLYWNKVLAKSRKRSFDIALRKEGDKVRARVLLNSGYGSEIWDEDPRH